MVESWRRRSQSGLRPPTRAMHKHKCTNVCRSSFGGSEMVTDLLNAGPAAGVVGGLRSGEWIVQRKQLKTDLSARRRFTNAPARTSTLRLNSETIFEFKCGSILVMCVKRHVSTWRKVSMHLPSCLFSAWTPFS